MTAATAEFTAGVYDGMPEDEYHGDPVPGGSLSCSGAKKLLPPSCPAKFAWEREHPPAPTEAMERGTAAHKLVLGVGAPITVIQADDWRTKKAQQERDAARAEGGVPLLAADWARVQAMRDALLGHPLAASLLSPARGKTEQSVFWPDPGTGIWRRARLDLMPAPDGGRRMIATDYKTARSADPAAISKTVANLRYYMQDPWYRDAIEAIYPGSDPAFLFIFQETEPPYLVTVAELHPAAVEAGRDLNRLAVERYRDCEESGIWPGYSPTDDIELIRLPAWATPREDYY